MSADGLPFSPAAERNAAPILEVLRAQLPAEAEVLEIASGTGQRAARHAGAQPGWRWQPTGADPAMLRAIAARCAGLPNVCPPIALDVRKAWPDSMRRFDAVYVANLLHIAPWPACAALMAGAAPRLLPGGALLVYGPFLIDGEPTAPSNLAFDADLRARDPAWGLRRLADVEREATAVGLAPAARVPMPANNQLLVFRRPA